MCQFGWPCMLASALHPLRCLLSILSGPETGKRNG